MAAVHDDIVAMPLQYHTMVGDMGSVLSGGQKQRVLLARALCQEPALLGRVGLSLEQGQLGIFLQASERLGIAIEELRVGVVALHQHHEQFVQIEAVRQMFLRLVTLGEEEAT